MQSAFDFSETAPGRGLAGLQHRLREVFGVYRCDWRLAPVQQLIKSIISSRTLDRDSWAAFWTLWDRFGPAEAIAAAPLEHIERAIAIVAWPRRRRLGSRRRCCRSESVDEVLTWSFLATGR